MRRKRVTVRVVKIAGTRYVRLPRRDPLIRRLSNFLKYEVRVERDPDDPANPLAYRIVLVPVRERHDGEVSCSGN